MKASFINVCDSGHAETAEHILMKLAKSIAVLLEYKREYISRLQWILEQ